MTDNALTPREQYLVSDSFLLLDRGRRLQRGMQSLEAKERTLYALADKLNIDLAFPADVDDVGLRMGAIDEVVEYHGALIAAETLGRVLDQHKVPKTLAELRELIGEARERYDVSNARERLVAKAVKPYRRGVMAASGRDLDQQIRMLRDEQYARYEETLDVLLDNAGHALHAQAEKALIGRVVGNVHRRRAQYAEPIDESRMAVANQVWKVLRERPKAEAELQAYYDEVAVLANDPALREMADRATTTSDDRAVIDVQQFEVFLQTARAEAWSRMTTESPGPRASTMALT